MDDLRYFTAGSRLKKKQTPEEIRERHQRRSQKYGRSSIHSLDNLARCLIGIVLTMAPWCLGGVDLNVQLYLYAGTLVALLLWWIGAVLSQLTTGLAPHRLPPLIFPLLAVPLLGAYQLTPANQTHKVTDTIAREIIAGDAEAWSAESGQRLNDSSLHQSAVTEPISPLRILLPTNYTFRTISVSLTRTDVARYGLAIVMLFLGAMLFQSLNDQARLWCLLAVNGAAISLFGVAQKLCWNGYIFWTIPCAFGDRPFASYLNRNNAAAYLNLSLAASVGFVYWARFRVEAQRLDRKDARKLQSENRGFVAKRILVIAMQNLAAIDRIQRFGLAAITIILVGIVVSGSKCGILSALTASIASLLLVSRLRKEHQSVVSMVIELGLLLFGIVVWAGLGGNLLPYVSLNGIDPKARMENWREAMNVVTDFPLVGAGMATYQYAYLPYHTSPVATPFRNAHNQFVEILVETGAVGLVLVVLIVISSLVSALSLARNPNRPAEDSSWIVCSLAIISQCVMACFDFGPTLASNLLTLAVLVGAISGRAARMADKEDLKSWWFALPGIRPSWMILVVGGALLANGLIDVFEVAGAAQARSACRSLPDRLDKKEALTADQLEHGIAPFDRCCDAQTGRCRGAAEIRASLGLSISIGCIDR